MYFMVLVLGKTLQGKKKKKKKTTYNFIIIIILPNLV